LAKVGTGLARWPRAGKFRSRQVRLDGARGAAQTAGLAFRIAQRFEGDAGALERRVETLELALVLEHPAAAPETRLLGLVQHDGIGILRAAEAPLALGTLARGFEPHDVAIEGGGTLEVGDHQLDIAEFAVADHGGQLPRENEAQLATAPIPLDSPRQGWGCDLR
jgi:hypothetical protein